MKLTFTFEFLSNFDYRTQIYYEKTINLKKKLWHYGKLCCYWKKKYGADLNYETLVYSGRIIYGTMAKYY